MNESVQGRSRRESLAGVAAALALLAAAPASAIHPGRWVHTTEADFEPGEKDKTVVTNLGDVKLAVGSEPVGGEVPEPSALILDMQRLPGEDGTLYLAAGPEGRLLKRDGDKIVEVLALPGEQVFALDVDAAGRLVVAVSGEPSRLAVLDGDELKNVVELPGVRYIWDVIVDGPRFILATGTEGQLLLVDPAKVVAAPAADDAEPAPETAPATGPADAESDAEGAAEADEDAEPVVVLPAGVTLLLDAAQANLLCLGRDNKGDVYVGTDTDGLVYRVTLKPDGTGESFVVYDAAEPEIGALLVMPNGMVYAGTADAEQARPGRLAEAAKAVSGRPGEAGEAAEPAAEPGEGEPAEEPQPGDLPQVPPEPGPIGDENAKPGADAVPEPSTTDPAQGAGGNDDPDSSGSSESPQPQGRRGSAHPGPLPKGEGERAVALTDEPAVADEPTAEQRDALRQVIRQRLEQARKTGALQAGPGLPTRRRQAPGAPSGPAGAPAQAAKEGNAIYRISPNGFVTEVFRESVMILKLLNDDGRLLVATGNEGELYRVDTDAQETTILADLEPQQVPAMLRDADGRVLLATANPASLVRLDQAFAAEGSYVGPVLDAAQISLWGKLNLTATIPEGTSIQVSTRSGNVQDPDQAAWSPWSEPETFKPDPNVAPLAPREMSIASPPARFLQYRLTLAGNGQASAVAERVEAAYVVPNIKPAITSIIVNQPAAPGSAASGGAAPTPAAKPGEEPAPVTIFNITWEAADPNADALRYKLEYQPAGSDAWLLIKDDLDQPTFEWETRRVPDGRYLVRVTATDGPDNPGDMARTATRRSDPVLVDNTPPLFEGLAAKVENRVATITATVRDGLSPVSAVHYIVNAGKEYLPVLPDDLIADSTRETVVIKLTDLAQGPHVVTLRAVDARGNVRYEAVTVVIK